MKAIVFGATGLALLVSVLVIGWRFSHDLAQARARAAHGSTVVATRCGPIEVQQAGIGAPLRVIHGSGGGHDQSMAYATAMAPQMHVCRTILGRARDSRAHSRTRVQVAIARSRFGCRRMTQQSPA